MSRLVKINLAYWLARLVPKVLLGGQRHNAWLALLLSAHMELNDQLIDYADMLAEEYKGSGQTIVLERMLRTRYADGQPKIWVVNQVLPDELYIYSRKEVGERVFAFDSDETSDVQEYIYSWDVSDRPDDLVGFRVEVEAGLWATLTDPVKASIRAFVNRFKPYAIAWLLAERT